MGKKELS